MGYFVRFDLVVFLIQICGLEVLNIFMLTTIFGTEDCSENVTWQHARRRDKKEEEERARGITRSRKRKRKRRKENKKSKK